MTATQRAADKAVTTAEERRTRVQEHTQSDSAHPGRRGPGRPPKVAPTLKQAQQKVETALHTCQRLTQYQEKVVQNIRAIGHTDHFVDLNQST